LWDGTIKNTSCRKKRSVGGSSCGHTKEEGIRRLLRKDFPAAELKQLDLYTVDARQERLRFKRWTIQVQATPTGLLFYLSLPQLGARIRLETLCQWASLSPGMIQAITTHLVGLDQALMQSKLKTFITSLSPLIQGPLFESREVLLEATLRKQGVSEARLLSLKRACQQEAERIAHDLMPSTEAVLAKDSLAVKRAVSNRQSMGRLGSFLLLFNAYDGVQGLGAGGGVTALIGLNDMFESITKLSGGSFLKFKPTSSLGKTLIQLSSMRGVKYLGNTGVFFSLYSNINSFTKGQHSAADAYWLARSVQQSSQIVGQFATKALPGGTKLLRASLKLLGKVAVPLTVIEAVVTSIMTAIDVNNKLNLFKPELELSSGQIADIALNTIFNGRFDYYKDAIQLKPALNEVLRGLTKILADNPVLAVSLYPAPFIEEPLGSGFYTMDVENRLKLNYDEFNYGHSCDPPTNTTPLPMRWIAYDKTSFKVNHPLALLQQLTRACQFVKETKELPTNVTISELPQQLTRLRQRAKGKLLEAIDLFYLDYQQEMISTGHPINRYTEHSEVCYALQQFAAWADKEFVCVPPGVNPHNVPRMPASSCLNGYRWLSLPSTALVEGKRQAFEFVKTSLPKHLLNNTDPSSNYVNIKRSYFYFKRAQVPYVLTKQDRLVNQEKANLPVLLLSAAQTDKGPCVKAPDNHKAVMVVSSGANNHDYVPQPDYSPQEYKEYVKKNLPTMQSRYEGPAHRQAVFVLQGQPSATTLVGGSTAEDRIITTHLLADDGRIDVNFREGLLSYKWRRKDHQIKFEGIEMVQDDAQTHHLLVTPGCNTTYINMRKNAVILPATARCLAVPENKDAFYLFIVGESGVLQLRADSMVNRNAFIQIDASLNAVEWATILRNAAEHSKLDFHLHWRKTIFQLTVPFPSVLSQLIFNTRDGYQLTIKEKTLQRRLDVARREPVEYKRHQTTNHRRNTHSLCADYDVHLERTITARDNVINAQHKVLGDYHLSFDIASIKLYDLKQGVLGLVGSESADVFSHASSTKQFNTYFFKGNAGNDIYRIEPVSNRPHIFIDNEDWLAGDNDGQDSLDISAFPRLQRAYLLRGNLTHQSVAQAHPWLQPYLGTDSLKLSWFSTSASGLVECHSVFIGHYLQDKRYRHLSVVLDEYKHAYHIGEQGEGLYLNKHSPYLQHLPYVFNKTYALDARVLMDAGITTIRLPLTAQQTINVSCEAVTDNKSRFRFSGLDKGAVRLAQLNLSQWRAATGLGLLFTTREDELPLSFSTLCPQQEGWHEVSARLPMIPQGAVIEVGGFGDVSYSDVFSLYMNRPVFNSTRYRGHPHRANIFVVVDRPSGVHLEGGHSKEDELILSLVDNDIITVNFQEGFLHYTHKHQVRAITFNSIERVIGTAGLQIAPNCELRHVDTGRGGYIGGFNRKCSLHDQEVRQFRPGSTHYLPRYKRVDYLLVKRDSGIIFLRDVDNAQLPITISIDALFKDIELITLKNEASNTTSLALIWPGTQLNLDAVNNAHNNLVFSTQDNYQFVLEQAMNNKPYCRVIKGSSPEPLTTSANNGFAVKKNHGAQTMTPHSFGRKLLAYPGLADETAVMTSSLDGVRPFSNKDCRVAYSQTNYRGVCQHSEWQVASVLLAAEQHGAHKIPRGFYLQEEAGHKTLINSKTKQHYPIDINDCQPHDKGRLLCQVVTGQQDKVLVFWGDTSAQRYKDTPPSYREVVFHPTNANQASLELTTVDGSRSWLTLNEENQVPPEAIWPYLPQSEQDLLIRQGRDAAAWAVFNTQACQRGMEYLGSSVLLHTRAGDAFQGLGFIIRWRHRDDAHWLARTLTTLRQIALEPNTPINKIYSLSAWLLETAVLHSRIQQGYQNYLWAPLRQWTQDFLGCVNSISQSCSPHHLIQLVRLFGDVLQFGLSLIAFLPTLLESVLPEWACKQALLWGLRGAISLVAVEGSSYWYLGLALFLLPQISLLLESLVGIPMTKLLSKGLEQLSHLMILISLQLGVNKAIFPIDKTRVAERNQVVLDSERRTNHAPLPKLASQVGFFKPPKKQERLCMKSMDAQRTSKSQANISYGY
jgi:hypothetical protein